MDIVDFAVEIQCLFFKSSFTKQQLDISGQDHHRHRNEVTREER